MIPKLPFQRELKALGTVLLVIYFISTFPFTVAVANKGLVNFLPPDTGDRVDAIVVLGRGEELRQSRAEVAAELWKAHRAPLIFASGAGDGEQIKQLLRAQDIPQQALDDESCSRTTEENAQFTATVLQAQGVKRVVLVTDPPHMLRSLLTFRSVGFTVIPHTSPLPSDLAPPKRAMIVFYEYMGLVSYGLQGEFFPQSFRVAKQPEIAVFSMSSA
jgi:uncharacterized SAM-binding protein YcdF (DUF218 family)